MASSPPKLVVRELARWARTAAVLLCVACGQSSAERPPAFVVLQSAAPQEAKRHAALLQAKSRYYSGDDYTYIRSRWLPEEEITEHTFVVFEHGRAHRRFLLRVGTSEKLERPADDWVVYDEWDDEIGTNAAGYSALSVAELRSQCLEALRGQGAGLRISGLPGVIHCGTTEPQGGFVTLAGFMPIAMPDDTRLCDYICWGRGRPVLPGDGFAAGCNGCRCTGRGSGANRRIRLDGKHSRYGCPSLDPGPGFLCTLAAC